MVDRRVRTRIDERSLSATERPPYAESPLTATPSCAQKKRPARWCSGEPFLILHYVNRMAGVGRYLTAARLRSGTALGLAATATMATVAATALLFATVAATTLFSATALRGGTTLGSRGGTGFGSRSGARLRGGTALRGAATVALATVAAAALLLASVTAAAITLLTAARFFTTTRLRGATLGGGCGTATTVAHGAKQGGFAIGGAGQDK
jgi:hypothetical protein